MLKKKTDHFKKKEKGFTLIELVISIGLMSVLMMGGVFSFMKLIENAKTIDEQIISTTNMNVLAQVLPKYIGMAVNVDWHDLGVSPITNVGAGKGQIAFFNSGFDIAPQPPINIGLFLRESGSPNPGNTRGNLKGTALYFRNPTPDTPGEFRITTSGNGSGVKNLYSDASTFIFSDLVGLSLSPAGHGSIAGEPVRSVRVQITMRKFFSGRKTNWCTATAITAGTAGCNSVDRLRETKFRDVNKTIFISLTNNRISDESLTTAAGVIKTESLYGSLYFFRPVRLR